MAAQNCTITTGPQPFPPFDPSAKTGVAKSSTTHYSPNTTLYPHSSLESYSGAEELPGEQEESLQARHSSLPSCQSEAEEEWNLRRSLRNSNSQKHKVGVAAADSVSSPSGCCHGMRTTKLQFSLLRPCT